MEKLGALVAFCALLYAVIKLSVENGRKAAKLDNLEREAKERQRASEIMDNVRRMDSATVRERLQDVSKK